jgi:23S rRNA (adenine2030-N6)-methyltransferase
MIWYPLKDLRATQRFARHLTQRAIPRMLRAELTMALVPAAERLAGTGLIVVNPPWRLETELTTLLPALAAVLAQNGRARLDWLTGEK